MLVGLDDIPFGSIDPRGTLERDAAEVIRLAKYSTMAVVVLQAIAAFSALGIVAIQWKAYADGKRKRRPATRRYARLRTKSRYTQLNRGRRR